MGKAIRRQLTAKGREALARRPKGEANEVEQADNAVEQAVASSVDEVKSSACGAGQKVKAARQKKRADIKDREVVRALYEPDAQRPTVQDYPAIRKQSRQTQQGRRAEVFPKAQAQKLQVVSQNRPAVYSVLPQPEQTSARQAPAGKSTSSSTKQTALTQPGGSCFAIRKKVKATAPKEKPFSGRTIIKTRQQVEWLCEKIPVKPGKKPVKTVQKQAQQQMKRHSQRKLAQQAQKVTEAAANVTRKAVVAIGKAVAAAFSAIAGSVGGGVLLVALCVILLVAAVVASPFGIFFSNEDPAPGMVTTREVVAEVNAEYATQIESLQAGNYDSVEMNGTPADWRDVLAVFAVKTAGAEDGTDVTTLDSDRVTRLKTVFWDMTTISHYVQTIRHPDRDPDDGVDDSWTERILHITVTGETADEAAAAYGFTSDQRAQLAELQAPENKELWLALLYGVSGADGQIVSVALSQVGNVGGQPYWSWYGFDAHVEWCACFVSWCANECGYIDSGTIPKFAGCVQGSRWFKGRGQWAERNIEPMPGMIVFFDWDGEEGQDSLPDHVGIVTRVGDGVVYTVEGNSGDTCRERHYPVGHYEIFGYGIPSY